MRQEKNDIFTVRLPYPVTSVPEILISHGTAAANRSAKPLDRPIIADQTPSKSLLEN
jgi:hypothetical protein